MLLKLKKNLSINIQRLYNLVKIMNKFIAITIGDINGIGIDILIKFMEKIK